MPANSNSFGGDIIWVGSFTEAMNYPLAPNNSLLLMDANNPVMYVKQVDSTGRTVVFDTYDLVKRETATTSSASVPSVESLEDTISRLIDKKLTERKKHNAPGKED